MFTSKFCCLTICIFDHGLKICAQNKKISLKVKIDKNIARVCIFYLNFSEGVDYERAVVNVTFEPDDDRQCIRITINEDDDIEGSENFPVTLMNGNPGINVGPNANVTITDVGSEWLYLFNEPVSLTGL